uniref:Uncharacterized protein n=1 Tax=Anguilla anguilla TaxID=7936 RepID=A0A0E9R5D4_ANGAN
MKLETGTFRHDPNGHHKGQITEMLMFLINTFVLGGNPSKFNRYESNCVLCAFTGQTLTKVY